MLIGSWNIGLTNIQSNYILALSGSFLGKRHHFLIGELGTQGPTF
jgi:hypothetical protein